MEKVSFGKTSDGKEAFLYEISNGKGMRLRATNYGATVVSIFMPDKNGVEKDIVLGYEQVLSYEKEGGYFGATVGRYCNRISDARIVIDGAEYVLDANDFENNLHSGNHSMCYMHWDVESHTENSITFTCVSKDLEQGFPGNVTAKVTYTLTENYDFEITYHAVSDKKTTMNFTNHAYFNLNGDEVPTILDNVLEMRASHYTPIKSSKAIPTGEIAPVEGTPFDFRTAKPIGQDIAKADDQLTYGNGYDHNYVLDRSGDGLELAAIAYSPSTGIRMEITTDCIGIQLYTGNGINQQKGKRGTVYGKNQAFCLETQYFPNSINEPNFKTPIYEAGEAFTSKTVHHFSIV